MLAPEASRNVQNQLNQHLRALQTHCISAEGICFETASYASVATLNTSGELLGGVANSNEA